MTETKRTKRQHVIINAFAMGAVSHLAPGQWRREGDTSENYAEIDDWVELAKLLERGKIHALFLADTLALYDVYKGPRNSKLPIEYAVQFPQLDGTYLVPPMAQATKHLGFGVTSTATYEEPYLLARKFSTLDHITHGRVGWNVVTSFLDSMARQCSLDNQLDHDDRYERAHEYMDVCLKLWEGSWSDKARIAEKESGRLYDADQVRKIYHKGKHFSVEGPHPVSPSPQRTPVIFQAGTSKAGIEFAAKYAEAVFMSGHLPSILGPKVQKLRSQAKALGRDPYSIKVIAGITLVVDETEEKARAKLEEYKKYGSTEGALVLFGGWTGLDLATIGPDEEVKLTKSNAMQSLVDNWNTAAGENLRWTPTTVGEKIALGGNAPIIVGNAEQVVDGLEAFIEHADVDGFNVGYMDRWGSFKDLVDFVIPELQRRGLFRTEYEDVPSGSRYTLRHNLSEASGGAELRQDHPGRRFNWAEWDPPVQQ